MTNTTAVKLARKFVLRIDKRLDIYWNGTLCDVTAYYNTVNYGYGSGTLFKTYIAYAEFIDPRDLLDKLRTTIQGFYISGKLSPNPYYGSSSLEEMLIKYDLTVDESGI